MYLLTKLAKHKVILSIVFVMALSLAFGTAAFATPNAACSTVDPIVACGTGETCTNKVCVANAAGGTGDTFGLREFNTGVNGTLGSEDLRTTIGSLINVALSLLGVIAVVIILLGGFKWMTAAGNEEKTTEARKLIFSGIIGLAIILSAWAIALFVIRNLSTATGSGKVPTDFTN